MTAACPEAHYAEDAAYLEEVDMRGLLKEFVADALIEEPQDVYAYLGYWARSRKTALAAATAEEDEAARKARLIANAKAAVVERMGDSEKLKYEVEL